jgi:hypothetical protein
MNKEFLYMQKLAGIITESEYKAKLEENVDANAASEEAKELLKDPKEMADIEAELGSLSESEGEEKRTKLQTALRLAGYGAIAGLLGTVPLAALAGASLKAILLAAAAGKLGGAATALTVGLAGEKEQRESLNENFVGMGMVGNIFDREKTDYELAFEHFTKGTSLNEVEEMVDSKMLKSYIDQMISLADDMEYTPEMVDELENLKNTLSDGSMSKEDALNVAQKTIDITGDEIGAAEALNQAISGDYELGEGIHDKDITSAPHTNVKGEMGNYDPKKRAANLAKLQNFGPKDKK